MGIFKNPGQYKFVHLILYILFSFFVLKNKKVYRVFGMRRSGNHAFISWLANSLERERCTINYTKHGRLGVSESKKIVHFNEVNKLSILEIWECIRETLCFIKSVECVIISFEDVPPEVMHFTAKGDGTNIFVERKMMNLLSSRMKGLLNFAEKGIGWPSFNVDNNFFQQIIKWKSASDIVCWSYERWLQDEAYRSEFLLKLNLEKDIMPKVTQHGGGSSFTGQMKNISKDETRWPVVVKNKEFVRNILERYSTLFDEDELVYLKKHS